MGPLEQPVYYATDAWRALVAYTRKALGIISAVTGAKPTGSPSEKAGILMFELSVTFFAEMNSTAGWVT
jgi:hypothetical protein